MFAYTVYLRRLTPCCVMRRLGFSSNMYGDQTNGFNVQDGDTAVSKAQVGDVTSVTSFRLFQLINIGKVSNI